MALIEASDVAMTFGGFGRPETHALRGVLRGLISRHAECCSPYNETAMRPCAV